MRPHADAATDVVDTLLAVQAENPRQSEWAVASRTREPSQSEIRALLDDGRLIRTHVLRPTWHYVLAEDLGWLLDLTAPRVRPTIARQLRRVHGLDGRALARATSVVLDTLAHGRHRTRRRIAEALHASGFDDDGQFVMILLAHLELDQLICSGRPDGGVHTYALLSERVPSTRRLDREEALGELALRYFTGHGPATDRDLAYWATLTVTDVRRGLERARNRLDCLEHDGRTYWHALGEVAPRRQARPVGHLLQILDEVYRGYQRLSW